MTERERYLRRMTARERGAVIAMQNRAIETACESEPWFVIEYREATQALARARALHGKFFDKKVGR